MKKHIMYLLSLMLFVTFGSQVCVAMDQKRSGEEIDPSVDVITIKVISSISDDDDASFAKYAIASNLKSKINFDRVFESLAHTLTNETIHLPKKERIILNLRYILINLHSKTDAEIIKRIQNLIAEYYAPICVAMENQNKPNPEVPSTETNLLEIPNDVLTLIFSFIPEELQNLLTTCKNFNQVVYLVCEIFLAGSRDPARILEFFQELNRCRSKQNILYCLLTAAHNDSISLEKMRERSITEQDLLEGYALAQNTGRIRTTEVLEKTLAQYIEAEFANDKGERKIDLIEEILFHIHRLNLASTNINQFIRTTYAELRTQAIQRLRDRVINEDETNILTRSIGIGDTQHAEFIVEMIAPFLSDPSSYTTNPFHHGCPCPSHSFGPLKNALILAIKGGHLALVQLMLEKLVFVKIPTQACCPFESYDTFVNFQNLIQVARDSEHQNIAQLLLATAQTYIKDKSIDILNSIVASDASYALFAIANLKNKINLDELFKNLADWLTSETIHISQKRTNIRTLQQMLSALNQKRDAAIVDQIKELITRLAPIVNDYESDNDFYDDEEEEGEDEIPNDDETTILVDSYFQACADGDHTLADAILETAPQAQQEEILRLIAN